MAYPRFVRSRQFKFVVGTPGTSPTVTGSAWADFAAGAYDLTLEEVQEGDVLRLELSAVVSTSTSQEIAVAFAVAGTVEQSGIARLTTPGTGVQQLTTVGFVTVTAAMLTDGAVTISPRASVGGAVTGTFHNVAGTRSTQFIAENLGPVQA